MTNKSKIAFLQMSPLFSARAMYYFYYMSLGSYLPFINLYYQRSGLSGVQIGTLAALPVLIALFVTFLWGAAADAFRLHRTILWAVLILAPLAVFLISQARTFLTLIPCVLAYGFVISPIVPLLDSNALEVAHEYQRNYGEMRVWGSIGWAVSTWLVGMLIEALNIHWLFYSYIILMTLTFLLSLSLPKRKYVQRSSIKHGLRKLYHRDFVIFLISIFLLTTASGGVNSFFSLYLDKIGSGEGIIGSSWALAALSELPIMIFSGTILRRIGARGILVAGLCIYTVLWWLYSVIDVPVWALVVQLLNGFSFACCLVGAVTFVSEHTPEGLSTTALAIYNTVAFSMASITGSMLGGYLYDTVGLSSLFRVFCLFGLASLSVFLLSGRRKVSFAGG